MHSLSKSELVEQLSSKGQFLNLSRFHPQYFSQPIEFTLANTTRVAIWAEGVICFEPLFESDINLVLSSGVHGNETAPIEICDTFVQQILRGELKVANRVLFIFGNLPAMNAGTRFVEENLNRLFSGAHSAEGKVLNPERLRALQLEQCVEKFFQQSKVNSQRLHYDLHTAIKPSKNEKFAVYPFLHGRAWNKQQLIFLLACGINTILLSESPTTTFSYFSSNQLDAEAFTVELGKVRPFGENDMGQFLAVADCLKKLLAGEHLSLEPFDNKNFLIYRVNQVINRESEDFKFSFSDQLPNFSDFAKGQLLAKDGLIEYYCQVEGEAIVFPNAKVELGQRAVLTVVPTTI